ncbi:hypothetical protein CEP52_016385 [Fusarium oligoseptatum]|uniref:Uncharacterized protein n=2 Tax=Fusarium solani species complex TaxID=232080 RepID=A0A428S477_9HYPO|nr:hypothetical protein CEP52_016385 [Fusarium oligoseptatum]RSL85604.1 hypothetical protein CEP51_003250 [Fusarium floridanum]
MPFRFIETGQAAIAKQGLVIDRHLDSSCVPIKQARRAPHTDRKLTDIRRICHHKVMSCSFPYYRPSLRRNAHAAFAQLSPAQRSTREQSQLTLCQATLEQTLYVVNPESRLGEQIQDTIDEIRRRLLVMLPGEQAAPKPTVEADDSEPPSSPNSSVYTDAAELASDAGSEQTAPSSRNTTSIGLESPFARLQVNKKRDRNDDERLESPTKRRKKFQIPKDKEVIVID